ncbi:aldo/keto reductase [Candidatus Moduliflexus flocculans]|uniref:Aldo/keto reductase n=1 Tax=Candidatus Moduliflexus flocculans TaxID=1499966 RepID=A0A081BLV0_9BACT|nr:aldo/keto reductase [Candidatus Moduliflexus flocculans]
MQYRKFGKSDVQVSALGFGAMRFPTKDGHIEEVEATQMMQYALDHGVNYIDTAYPYHGGESEKFVGRFLSDGKREKVKLATKLPSWLIEGATDFDKYFEEQCERLQTGTIDYYLLHSLNRNWWPKLRDLGVIAWAERKMAEGRIGQLGFSFHDGGDAFQPIVDGYDWAFCQIQYNYMDVENQAGTAGLKYAASKGMAVIIMEPVLGGSLADPPAPVQRIWDGAAQKRNAVDWALQWLWNQPEVTMVLSGMSSLKQVEENVRSAENARVNSLSAEELAMFDAARTTYQALRPIPCTACSYCMPCPNNVNIPRNFGIYNKGKMYDKADGARGEYAWMSQELKLGIATIDTRAAACVECGVCDAKCPQQIPISSWMPVVHQVLGEGREYQSRP